MPSVGSLTITLSRIAARNTERMLTTRVLIVPGASPRIDMAFNFSTTPLPNDVDTAQREGLRAFNA